MAKKKTNKQPWSSSLESREALYKGVIKRKNKYSLGSWFEGATGDIKNWNEGITNKLMGSNFGQGLSNLGIKAGGLGGIANTAATAIGGLAAGGRSSAVGNVMQKVGSLASNIPGVGGLIGAGVNLLGGVVNGAFGSKLNAENIAAVEGDIKQALNFTSNAGDYDALASNYAGLQGVMGFDKGFIGKDGWIGGSKAKRKFNSLKTQAEEAEVHQLLALSNNAQNIADTNLQLLEANYNAYGGPINMKYKGTMSPFGNQFGDGGSKNSIPTQEEYIAQQIAAKRTAALDKSRNRTSIRVPMIENTKSKEDWENSILNRYKAIQEDLNLYLSDPKHIYSNTIKSRKETLKSLEDEYRLGYPKLVPGANCLYNAADCYGLDITSNVEFATKAKQLGFKKGEKGSMEPGDIVQDVKAQRPVHAMIYDSKDKEGNLLFNYARGYDDNDAFDIDMNYVRQGKYPIPIKDLDVYKYVGTPADSTQWINEYKEMYNKKADGGPLGEENPSNYDRDNNKRTYIGGTTSEARKKYFNYDKELTQIVTNLATSYGISPSLVIDRLAHEGLIDHLIRDNNEYLSHNGDPNYPSDTFDFDDYNEPFGLLGLDNIFDTYTKGITKTKRPINMIKQINRNERGELVNSAETKNLYDTLELFTAELASRREQIKKQYPNLTDDELDSATAARYNASNKYFKRLMDSGKYKTEYPIDVEGINIPTPTKTDSKYIQDQVQNINKSDVLNAFENYHYFSINDLIDESTFTVGDKSYNPGLFINEENYEFNSDSPLVDRFIDNYVNRNFTIPSKVKVVDDYYYEGDGKDMMYLNKKAEGGNLFTNGVTMVNNGGTHEYLEGQEYDVTEEEIKLLKKLGYEFEYL